MQCQLKRINWLQRLCHCLQLCLLGLRPPRDGVHQAVAESECWNQAGRGAPDFPTHASGYANFKSGIRGFTFEGIQVKEGSPRACNVNFESDIRGFTFEGILHLDMLAS